MEVPRPFGQTIPAQRTSLLQFVDHGFGPLALHHLESRLPLHRHDVLVKNDPFAVGELFEVVHPQINHDPSSPVASSAAPSFSTDRADLRSFSHTGCMRIFPGLSSRMPASRRN